MRWAAFGALLAAGSYALLFPPSTSALSAMNLAALLLLSVLSFAAPTSERAATLLRRALGATLLAPIFASAAFSTLAEAVLTRSLPPLGERLHETAAAGALSFIAAQCASLTRRESLARATA